MPPVRARALTPQEELAWRALTYVSTHLIKTLGEDLAVESPISLSEYVVLVHLSESDTGHLRIGDLATNSTLSPSRMSRLVDDMANKGLLTKNRVPNDRRATTAALTPLGRQTLRATYPTQLRNVRRRVFDVLTPDDVDALSSVLGKIRVSLEQRESPLP